MRDHILERIPQQVLPESRAALAFFLEQDRGAKGIVQERLQAEAAALEAMYSAFGGKTGGLQAFLSAWLMMQAAFFRLDHLQDNDISNLAPYNDRASVGEQYNLVFTYYVLAASLLDDLDEVLIPAKRIRLLIRMWNDSVLWVASGQQRDLARTGPRAQVDAVLEHYQETIEAKAGAVYALGFGGTGTLATDDQESITALSLVGRIYGTLLQFSDDFLDAAAQTDQALALPQVYSNATKASGLALPSHDLQQYWNHLYWSYFGEVQAALATLPTEVQRVILKLFRNTFEV